MKRPSTAIKAQMVGMGMRPAWSRGRLNRGWMTGLWMGLLVVLACMSAQAQTMEDRIEKLENTMSQMTKALPVWRKRFEFDGDLRLRYQYEDITGEEERHRGRFRYRLAVTANITDQLKTVFGLASGGSDPRSTNQTFGDSFSSKPVQIDLAYAQYQPLKAIKLVGGKFKNPIWLPSDLLWDSDINPEGGAAQLDFETAVGLDILFNIGIFVIDEESGGGDPLVVPIQGGVSYEFNERVDFQLAVTYYSFVDVQGHTLDFSEQFAGIGNTVIDDALVYDYDSISVGAEVGFNKFLGKIMPYIGLFGEYVYNFDPDDDNEGYLGGIKIGHRKVSEGGQWQATFLYRYLERDAWPDVFPDSDFLGGSTNGEGVQSRHSQNLGYSETSILQR